MLQCSIVDMFHCCYVDRFHCCYVNMFYYLYVLINKCLIVDRLIVLFTDELTFLIRYNYDLINLNIYYI